MPYASKTACLEFTEAQLGWQVCTWRKSRYCWKNCTDPDNEFWAPWRIWVGPTDTADSGTKTKKGQSPLQCLGTKQRIWLYWYVYNKELLLAVLQSFLVRKTIPLSQRWGLWLNYFFKNDFEAWPLLSNCIYLEITNPLLPRLSLFNLHIIRIQNFYSSHALLWEYQLM